MQKNRLGMYKYFVMRMHSGIVFLNIFFNIKRIYSFKEAIFESIFDDYFCMKNFL